MAGSADITGRQNYVMGIGHPKTETTTESSPAMVLTDPLTGETVQTISVVTQAQYDALGTKDAKTLYIIKG